MPLATNSSRNVNQRIKKNDFRTPQNSGPGNDAHEEKVPHSKSSVRCANMNFFSADFFLDSREGLRQKARIARSMVDLCKFSEA